MRKSAVLLILCFYLTTASAQKVQKLIDKAHVAYDSGDNTKAKELLQSALIEVPAQRSTENDRMAEEALVLLMEIDSYSILNVDGPKFIRKLDTYYGSSDTISADYLGFFGGIAFGLGEYSRADRLFEKALKLFEGNGVTTSLNYGAIASNLGLMKVMTGKFDEAFVPLEKAKNVFDQDPDFYLVELAIVHSNLGQAHQSAYNELQALNHYQVSLQCFEDAKYLEEDYYNTLSNLATLYTDFNQYDAGKELGEKVLKRVAKVKGVASEKYARSCNNLAVINNALGRFQEAEELYQQAANIKMKLHSKKHPSYILSLANQGKFFSDMGRHAQGLVMVEEAIALCRDNQNVSSQI